MTIAINRDIAVDQGTTYQETYTAKIDASTPLDITNYDIRMDIRRSRDQSTPEFQLELGTTTMPDPEGGPDLIVSNGIEILNGPNGEFEVIFRPDQSAGFAFSGDSVDLVYDLELQEKGTIVVIKAFKGTFRIDKEVTKLVYYTP